MKQNNEMKPLVERMIDSVNRGEWIINRGDSSFSISWTALHGPSVIHLNWIIGSYDECEALSASDSARLCRAIEQYYQEKIDREKAERVSEIEEIFK